MDHVFQNAEGSGFLYRLSGLSKLIAFLALSFAAIFSYDTRFIVGLILFSALLFSFSSIRFSQIKWLLLYVGIFLLINFVLTYIFAPEYGVELYGTRHEIATIFGRYTITQEQLLYQITKLLKYLSVIPLGILFFFTTNPSEFAASLNRIKIPYKASYALSLTLRYFPDLLSTYRIISKAQQARGLAISKKNPLRKRIKHAVLTIIPLIFSTMDRIDVISSAMDLRGFAKQKRRTWYSSRSLAAADYLAIIVSIIILLGSFSINIFFNNGSRFFNPFV